MSAHTPGPWRVDGNTDIRVHSIGGKYVARIFSLLGTDSERDRVTEQANAQLIAAAPDLLTAAKEIEALVAAHVYPQPDKPDSKWAKLVRLREAIAKAEGR